MFIVDIIKKR